MYVCESNGKQQTDYKLDQYECTMLNGFELHNVHVRGSEIEKWSICSTTIDYIEYNRKTVPENSIKFKPTEAMCQKGYRQIKSENRTCKDIDFDPMTEELQPGYLYRCEDVKAKIHYISQFDESSDLSTAYLGEGEMSRENALKAQKQFSPTDQSTTMGTSLDGTDCKLLLDNGASKSFMSKQYYLRNNCLHGLPKFKS